MSANILLFKQDTNSLPSKKEKIVELIKKRSRIVTIHYFSTLINHILKKTS